ncbi:hypothetical protein [Streptomyces sp. c-19]|uniref:hypothetical protein n=1 Tax=Streptomyces sp. c-19 TaxID=2789275 RepID=UPI00397F9AB8
MLPRYRRVYRVVKGEQRRFKRDQWWTSRESILDQDKHEVMRQRQEAERAEREARQQEREEAAERRRKELEARRDAGRGPPSLRNWPRDLPLRGREARGELVQFRRRGLMLKLGVIDI